jgi:hypothetical protein
MVNGISLPPSSNKIEDSLLIILLDKICSSCESILCSIISIILSTGKILVMGNQLNRFD